jgi:hypothetical protein
MLAATESVSLPPLPAMRIWLTNAASQLEPWPFSVTMSVAASRPA